MKRSFVALSLLVLLVAACASTTPSTGIITAVGDNTVTVSVNGEATTYNLTSSTYVYNSQGARTRAAFLTNGQRVRVVANAEKEAVTINIES